MRSFVFTLIGPDRPGIVDAVARCIAEHRGNWEESQLAQVAGQFAGIVRVTVPADYGEGLRHALSELPDLKLVVADGEQSPAPATVHLELIGADRPGIIQQIGHALAQLGANVVEMDTRTERAAMSGEPIFRVDARVALPEAVDLAGVRASLEAIANELMVEIHLGEDG